MQRQSVGSPSLKFLKDEQLVGACETQKQFPSQSSSSISSSSTSSTLITTALPYEDEEELKKKMIKSKTTTYIHFIPVLTLLCFLILYLSSHDPSTSPSQNGIDLTQFNVPKTFSTAADKISELQGIKKGDMLVIRSLKSLEEVKHRRLLHRKIAH